MVRWAGSGCMNHRKRRSLRVGDYRQLLARVNILRLSLQRLMRGIEIQAEDQFFRLDIEEYGNPARVAEQVRNAWNLPRGPVPHLTKAIEAAGWIVLKCDFGTPRLDAFSQWPPGMPPLFFVNVSAPPDRCRWTLAHEIGHIIMHVVPTPNLEREADEFAAELLMPRRDIASDLGRPFSLQKAAALKARWRVAMSAVIRRAKDLWKITPSRYTTLMTQMGKLGYRKHEPVPLEPEEPSVVRGMLGVHLSLHGYSIEELGRVAMLSPDDLLRLFPVPQQEQREPVPHLRPVT